MVKTPPTCMTLRTLIKLETDVDSWREFVRFYSPVIYGFARKRGLKDAGAANVMRAVLRSVARGAGTVEYNPKCETTSAWLYSVTCDQIRHLLSTQKNRSRGTGDSCSQINSAADHQTEPDSDWELEYQRQLAVKAMESVKQQFDSLAWQAFWKTAIDGRPALDVGLELRMPPGEVYVAKSRVLVRLREEVRHLKQHGTPKESL
jgi:RNA polymerase sigma factor (sigma-70 family)